MERRERGFFGRLLVFILTILAVVGLIAMGLSVVNAYINPQRFIWTTLFGLAFWVILIYNVLVFLFLLLLWSKKAWISVLALLIAIPGISKSYSIGSKAQAENSIRVMSYNVHAFSHIDSEIDKERCAYQIMNLVREQNPDIFCCQEFSSFILKIAHPKCINIFAENCGFPYIYYNRKRNYGGNVIFSKYPIVKVTEDSEIGKEQVYGVMVSVDAGEKGQFHVANVHLLSYKISDNEIDVLTNTSGHQDQLDTIGMTVLLKLSDAFRRRSIQLKNVLDGMPPVEGPIIMCGDFNEPPLSYNYRQLQKAGFVDTFTKVGRGIKPTYAGKLPLLRIDYIWANKGVVPLNFKRCRFKASDHYPILLDFSINPENQSVNNLNQTTNTL